MAGEWTTATIEEVSEKVAMGPFGSSIKVETFVPNGIPVISGQHLRGHRLDETSGFNFITPEHAERLRNANVQRGDVIFTHAGNIGQVAYIPEDSRHDKYIISQRQFYMRPNRRRVIPEIVAYYFKSPEGRHRLLANASQVGVPSLAQPVTYLRTIEISVPPLDEQRAIAYILGTLDDKIELNRRMNETLEAIAQAIFKSWFIDASQDGLPKGWKKGTVGEDFDITMGQSPPGETYNEIGEGLPFFQGRTDFGFRFPALRVYCTAPTRIANSGDTLVCVRAPVGDVNMASQQCCVGRGLAAVRHRTGSRSYTYYAMYALREDFDRFEAEGTVFGSMNKKDFHAISYVAPPEEKVKDFEALVSPLDQLIENNENESQTLAALRDMLLPKLLSGKIRVKKLEGLEAELRGGN